MFNGFKVMIFAKDQYYNSTEVAYYSKDTVCKVPDDMVDRWVKRGGHVLTEEELELLDKGKHVVRDGKVVVKKDGEEIKLGGGFEEEIAAEATVHEEAETEDESEEQGHEEEEVEEETEEAHEGGEKKKKVAKKKKTNRR